MKGPSVNSEEFGSFADIPLAGFKLFLDMVNFGKL